jgi:hypothetical protein
LRDAREHRSLDETAGENLKKIVEDHSKACDEIKEKLAGRKEGTMQQKLRSFGIKYAVQEKMIGGLVFISSKPTSR